MPFILLSDDRSIGEVLIEKRRFQLWTRSKNLDAIGALSERTVDKFQNTSVISKNDEWKPMLNQGSMVTSRP